MKPSKLPTYHKLANDHTSIFRELESLPTVELSGEVLFKGKKYNPNTPAPAKHYILIIDEKSAGTGGGTFTAGAWQTRDLNTVKTDTGSHASLSNNQITLAAGTYEVEISCPACAVNSHKARLYNITDSTTALVGTTEFAYSGMYTFQTRSFILGVLTIDEPKVFEVQHRCSSTRKTDGFGKAANYDEVEVYTVAQFYKVG